MKHKNDLTKIALAALILASASPVNGQANVDAEATGIFLAAGCPAHGCNTPTPSKSNQANTSESYNSRNSTYQSDDNRNQYYNPNNQSAMTNQGNYSSGDMVSQGSEDQLLRKLSPQAKAIYRGLNQEGKAMAIKLANQFEDKDADRAVQEAQQRTNQQQGMMNR